MKILALGLINLSKKLKLKDEAKHIIYYNEPEGSKNKDLLIEAKSDDTSPLIFKHWEEFEEDEKRILDNPVRKFSEYKSNSYSPKY